MLGEFILKNKPLTFFNILKIRFIHKNIENTLHTECFLLHSCHPVNTFCLQSNKTTHKASLNNTPSHSCLQGCYTGFCHRVSWWQAFNSLLQPASLATINMCLCLVRDGCLGQNTPSIPDGLTKVTYRFPVLVVISLNSSGLDFTRDSASWLIHGFRLGNTGIDVDR